MASESLGRKFLLGAVVVIALGATVVLKWPTDLERQAAVKTLEGREPAAAGWHKEAAATPEPAARPAALSLSPADELAVLAREIRPDAISPIAGELNAPDGRIERDLEILRQVFEAWRTNFPGDGNPVGENEEITLALAGANELRYAFISPKHPAISKRGELCDRWGTPFRFHALSGTNMETFSAGPDRQFGTADDVPFASGRNTE